MKSPEEICLPILIDFIKGLNTLEAERTLATWDKARFEVSDIIQKQENGS